MYSGRVGVPGLHPADFTIREDGDSRTGDARSVNVGREVRASRRYGLAPPGVVSIRVLDLDGREVHSASRRDVRR
jgi:hypothetical protein